MRISPITAMTSSLLVLCASYAGAQPPRLQEAREQARQAYRRALADARELYQGRNRGPEQTADTLSRKIKVGRDGRVSISNISGTITVTAAAGDEMSIDAVKRGRGDRRDFDRVHITIDDRPGRVEIRTEYDRSFFRNDDISVDYTLVVPAGVALDVSSVSGRIRVDGVKGSTRLGTVSGNITSANTPKIENVRTVSGAVDLGGISQDGSLSISSVSGNLDLNGVRVRSLDVNTVSGETRLRDAAIERLSVKGLSGAVEYAGTLVKGGRYEVNSHSGNVRFTLGDNTGFELNAGSFSGSVRSDYQMTVGGNRNPEIRRGRGRGRPDESMQAAFGDGSASLNLHTFSGTIAIAKK
jgi:DUF4097 and DUF4098 domain-containing protein YvlB